MLARDSLFEFCGECLYRLVDLYLSRLSRTQSPLLDAGPLAVRLSIDDATESRPRRWTEAVDGSAKIPGGTLLPHEEWLAAELAEAGLELLPVVPREPEHQDQHGDADENRSNTQGIEDHPVTSAAGSRS